MKKIVLHIMLFYSIFYIAIRSKRIKKIVTKNCTFHCDIDFIYTSSYLHHRLQILRVELVHFIFIFTCKVYNVNEQHNSSRNSNSLSHSSSQRVKFEKIQSALRLIIQKCTCLIIQFL